MHRLVLIVGEQTVGGATSSSGFHNYLGVCAIKLVGAHFERLYPVFALDRWISIIIFDFINAQALGGGRAASWRRGPEE